MPELIRALLAFAFGACLIATAAAIAPSQNDVVILQGKRAQSQSTAFVTAQTLGSGPRNDATISLGFQFTVGSAPITVTDLGRWVIAGSSQSHAMSIVRVSDKRIMAIVSVPTAGRPPGTYAYATLTFPVTLASNTSYYLLTPETGGGDSWYNDAGGGSMTTTGVATINNSVWTADSITWNTGPAGLSFGPVNFKYLVSGVPPTPPTGAFNPSNPAASGYSLVFDDEFNSISTVDVNNSGATGFNWYTRNFFGGFTTAGRISVSGGALSLSNSDNHIGLDLATVAPAANADGFVGRAYGGGAYFEARLKFNPAAVNPGATGWPSFWSNSIEIWVNNGRWNANWPGQTPVSSGGPNSGYNHFAELDFLEYDLGTTAQFNNAFHDWYGVKNQCGGGWYCDINNNPNGGNGGASSFTNGQPFVPGGAPDWSQYHTIGQLWVAGNAANGFNGYVQGYFDNVPTTAKVTWKGPPNANPPPVGTAQFSIIDQQHMAVVLGTDTSGNTQYTVDWVHVWQIPGQGNCIGSNC